MLPPSVCLGQEQANEHVPTKCQKISGPQPFKEMILSIDKTPLTASLS